MFAQIEIKSTNRTLWAVFVIVTIGVAVAIGSFVGWCIGTIARKLIKKF